MPQLLIDIVGYGSGPLTSAGSWKWSWELDRSGSISFPVSVGDPQSMFLDTARNLTAYRLVDGGPPRLLGAGVVEEVTDRVAREAGVQRTVQGSDLLIELGNRSVRELLLSDGAGGPMAAASVFPAMAAYLPAGWSIAGTPSAAVYAKFAGESVLTALGKLAERTGDHFILVAPTTRQVLWLPKTTPNVASGVRAVGNGDPVALRSDPRVCVVTDLSRVKDVVGVYSRIYAYGSGNADARLTLAGGTWTPPAGYTLDVANNCLINDAADAARRVDHYQSFKDIGMSGSSSADTISAVNALRQAAYEELRRHLVPQNTYNLSVTKIDVDVRPGQTIRVVLQRWLGGYHVLDIDEDLYILAVETQVDDNGASHVAGLTVSTIDRWPVTDMGLLAGAVTQVNSMEAYTQPVVSAAASSTAISATTAGDVDRQPLPLPLTVVPRYVTSTASSPAYIAAVGGYFSRWTGGHATQDLAYISFMCPKGLAGTRTVKAIIVGTSTAEDIIIKSWWASMASGDTTAWDTTNSTQQTTINVAATFVTVTIATVTLVAGQVMTIGFHPRTPADAGVAQTKDVLAVWLE